MKAVQHLVERLTLSDCMLPALVLVLATGGLLAWSILSLQLQLH
jgi:hypothetical protein